MAKREGPPQINRHLSPLFFEMRDSLRVHLISAFTSKERCLSIENTLFSGITNVETPQKVFKTQKNQILTFVKRFLSSSFFKKWSFFLFFQVFSVFSVFCYQNNCLNSVKTQKPILWKPWFCSSICIQKCKIWSNLLEFNEAVRCKVVFFTISNLWKNTTYRRGNDENSFHCEVRNTILYKLSTYFQVTVNIYILSRMCSRATAHWKCHFS